MVSVVLAIYNGEQHIVEQLESIKEQTQKADEVLIVDDLSSDNSFIIVKSYIDKHNLHNWKVIKNAENMGWKRNFQKGLSLARGEYIFLCDQDDIWLPTKIEEMVRIMSHLPQITLLACSYEPFYEDDITKKISKRIIKSMKDDGQIKPIPLSGGFMSVNRPGCTYCVRRELVKFTEKYWLHNTPHDAALWRISILEGGAFVYDKKLIKWRRYSSSNSNPNRLATEYSNNRELEHFNLILNVIEPDLMFLEGLVRNNKYSKNKLIQKQLRVYKNRMSFFTNSSYKNMIQYLFSGIASGFPLQTIIHDFLIEAKYKH